MKSYLEFQYLSFEFRHNCCARRWLPTETAQPPRFGTTPLCCRAMRPSSSSRAVTTPPPLRLGTTARCCRETRPSSSSRAIRPVDSSAPTVMIAPFPLFQIKGFFQNRDASERRRMIAEHIRSKLVVHDYRDDDGVCVICQENLAAENRKIVRLDCGHHYHQECIINWLNVKNSCRLCQTTVLE